jgi:Icc protein
VKRRHFICNVLSTAIAIQIPGQAFSAFAVKPKAIKIGLITDLHQDLIHNAADRLNVFVDHMKKIKPDAILQIGDFAYPGEKNKQVIDMFNKAHVVPMHVIGNHDTDAGYTKQQCIDYWGMPGRYYAKEVQGINFIILDGNDKGSPTHKGGYPAYVGDEQMTWLQTQLKESDKPVIVVSHQPLAGSAAVDNAEAIQDMLSNYKQKVLLAINGHTHIDALYTVKGINYVHINSASYFWMGGEYKHTSYSEEVHQSHPWISSTCPYKDSLYAVMTIEPATGVIKIEGRKSEWVGASPEALKYKSSNILPGKEIVPAIRDRKIKFWDFFALKPRKASSSSLKCRGCLGYARNDDV